jgi:hypothetical protein
MAMKPPGAMLKTAEPHLPAAAAGSATAVKPMAAPQPDIKIYSHSPILYWWPVWVVGFIMAIVTLIDGGRMAYTPPGSVVEGNHLVAPAGKVIEQPYDRVAHNPYLGTIFFLTLLIVFVASNVQLRGLWEWITILGIALFVAVISLYGWWQRLVEWFNVVHIHINMAGYIFLSVWFLVIWALSVYLFDRRTYIIFSSGQVRIRDQIGQAEKVYDVTNMTFQIQPNVFFRHRILGLYGAGDLVVRTGGPHSELLEWPNVLFVRSRLKQIEERLKSREVV